MLSSRRTPLVLLALISLASSSAWAQRREGSSSTPTGEAKLPSPVQFGEITIPARLYRVSLTPQGFSFIDPQSLVAIASVPVTVAENAESVPAAKLDVSEKGLELRLVMHYENRSYTAVGKKLTAPTDASSSAITYDPLSTKALPASTEPNTPLAVVEAALPRLEKSVVSQCADRAHKARWETDNPQFDKCVCPQVAKWRLPKHTEELRVQRPLAKGRNGYSFTVDTAGRTKNCRVWSGATAPADDSLTWRPGKPAAATAKPTTSKSSSTPATPSAEKKSP